MTLDQFHAETSAFLARFVVHYKAENAKDPAAYPLDLEEGDSGGWWEMLLTFEDSKPVEVPRFYEDLDIVEREPVGYVVPRVTAGPATPAPERAEAKVFVHQPISAEAELQVRAFAEALALKYSTSIGPASPFAIDHVDVYIDTCVAGQGPGVPFCRIDLVRGIKCLPYLILVNRAGDLELAKAAGQEIARHAPRAWASAD